MINENELSKIEAALHKESSAWKESKKAKEDSLAINENIVSSTKRVDNALLSLNSSTKESGNKLTELKDRVRELNVELDILTKQFEKQADKGLAKAAEETSKKIEEITEKLKATKEALILAEKSAENLKNIFSVLDQTIGGLGSTIGKGSLEIGKMIVGVGSVYQLAALAAKTMFDWYEHTAAINRNIYDTNAALGAMGDAGGRFEDTITSTAWKFKENADTVAKHVYLLAQAGVEQEEMADAVNSVYIYSKLWTELSPEKQIALMSTFMKEFNLSGKDAGATMIGIFETAQKLKKEYPGIVMDAGKFTEQTSEVAVHMRRYGLEVTEAIALTATLTRLGVEQARIPELSKGLGTMTLEDTAVRAVMTEKFLAPKLEARYQELYKLGPLAGQEAAEFRELSAMQKGGTFGTVGAYGVAEKYQPQMLLQSQLEWMRTNFESMTGQKMEGAGRATWMGFTEIAGKTLGIDLGKEATAQFAEAMIKLKPGEDINKALLGAMKEAKDIQKAADEKALKRIENAAAAAVATQTMAETVKNIESTLGRMAAKYLGVTKTSEFGFEMAITAMETGKPLSAKEISQRTGLSIERASEILESPQYRHAELAYKSVKSYELAKEKGLKHIPTPMSAEEFRIEEVGGNAVMAAAQAWEEEKAKGVGFPIGAAAGAYVGTAQGLSVTEEAKMYLDSTLNIFKYFATNVRDIGNKLQPDH